MTSSLRPFTRTFGTALATRGASGDFTGSGTSTARYAICWDAIGSLPVIPCPGVWTNWWSTRRRFSHFCTSVGRGCSMRGSMSFSTNGQQTNTLKGLPASTPAPVYLRRYKHPYDGQELKVHGRRRHADGRHFLNVEMAWPAFPYPGELDYPVWPGEFDTGRPRLYSGFLVSA